VRKLKVLVGGAETVFCSAKKAALEFWGCDVTVVTDGKQACAALSSAHVDLCILDWDLPKMTGLGTCRWIRSVNKKQPHIVLLTEKADREQIQAAYLAGANDFMAKPLNLEDLHFLISEFAQRVWQQELSSRQLTHVDPLELYRRDLTTSKVYSRL